jgi:hypothetical protein
MTFDQQQLRTVQGLTIGGVISIFIGVGIGTALIATGQDEGIIPGLVMLSIGLALLISARIVKSSANDSARR